MLMETKQKISYTMTPRLRNFNLILFLEKLYESLTEEYFRTSLNLNSEINYFKLSHRDFI